MFVCYTMKLRAIKTVQSKDSFILRLEPVKKSL